MGGPGAGFQVPSCRCPLSGRPSAQGVAEGYSSDEGGKISKTKVILHVAETGPAEAKMDRTGHVKIRSGTVLAKYPCVCVCVCVRRQGIGNEIILCLHSNSTMHAVYRATNAGLQCCTPQEGESHSHATGFCFVAPETLAQMRLEGDRREGGENKLIPATHPKRNRACTRLYYTYYRIQVPQVPMPTTIYPTPPAAFRHVLAQSNRRRGLFQPRQSLLETDRSGSGKGSEIDCNPDHDGIPWLPFAGPTRHRAPPGLCAEPNLASRPLFGYRADQGYRATECRVTGANRVTWGARRVKEVGPDRNNVPQRLKQSFLVCAPTTPDCTICCFFPSPHRYSPAQHRLVRIGGTRIATSSGSGDPSLNRPVSPVSLISASSGASSCKAEKDTPTCGPSGLEPQPPWFGPSSRVSVCVCVCACVSGSLGRSIFFLFEKVCGSPPHATRLQSILARTSYQ